MKKVKNVWVRAAHRSLCGDQYLTLNITHINRSVKPYLWTALVVMALVVFGHIADAL
jgi:hypothetical protein